MCAINGFNWEDRDLIDRMNKATLHRGPDGTGVYKNKAITLGHNRLAIIDPRTIANQPMSTEDGRYTIIFNGEIYNFLELKAKLESSYFFRTKSDTEVVLAGFSKKGIDFIKELNGIFAFAIWDNQKGTLYLARDRSGIKPLYYYNKNNTLIFSSEIKAILEHDVPRVLNKEALEHYMRLSYVPAPLTMFNDIFKLYPGKVAVFKNSVLTISSFVLDKKVSAPNSFTEAKERVFDTLTGSVKSQLISDRPLGLYLSGGFDSSILLERFSGLRTNIDTFSVGFILEESEELEKYNKDFYLARKTAEFYGTHHHEVLIEPNEVPALFESAVYHLDEPISNPTVVAMLKLSHFAKETVDVVLGGDGGDELFGGYDRYRLSHIASQYQRLPASLRKAMSFGERLKKLNTPPGVERHKLFMYQPEELIQSVVKPIISSSTYKYFQQNYFDQIERDFENQFMNVDRGSWLVDESLAKTDKMSMANALEARVPFLDNDMIALAESIPSNYKLGLFNKKKVLKEAFRGRLPPYLFDQPKRGFFSPGSKWLRYPSVSTMAKVVLSESYYKETAGLFKWSEIESVLEKHLSHKHYNLDIIWALMTFQIWARRYRVTMPV